MAAVTHRPSGAGWRRLVIGCLLLAALLLAVYLRLRQAQASLVFDELASMYFSRQSLGDLWGWWLLRETNPPLFYTLLKGWRAVVPADPVMLRMMPLAFSLVQIVLLSRFAGKTYGWPAALACLLLFALSPSDIYLSSYIRAYGLAKLAVTVSFLGLLHALGGRGSACVGWAVYAAGSVVAIYTHTTMILWPVIATVAVLAEAAWRREIGRGQLVRLLVANLAVILMSAWELIVAVEQMRMHSGNISWIEPLPLSSFGSSANLQLLLGGSLSSGLMEALMVIGVMRTVHNRVTRLSAVIVASTLVAFKLADLVHPITTDFTLHWCFAFTALLAGAALVRPRDAPAPGRLWVWPVAAGAAIVAILGDGLLELDEGGAIPQPQDWGYVLDTVAKTPGAALLVSHESIGVVVSQACMLRYHQPRCPFPLVVMQNPAGSDSWATGGYGQPLIPPGQVRAALGPARQVFAFSRFVYTPLAPFGLDPGDYHEVEWDDGELIGPIPIERFPYGEAR